MTDHQNEYLSALSIRLSAGEILDRETIWQLKLQKAGSDWQGQLIQRHHNELLISVAAIYDLAQPYTSELRQLHDELQAVNKALWQCEDELRLCESRKDFGEEFVELARSVYEYNDHRAELKRQVNALTDPTRADPKMYITNHAGETDVESDVE